MQLNNFLGLTLVIFVASIAIVVVLLTVFDIDDLRGNLWSALDAIHSAAHFAVYTWESAIECSAFFVGRIARALVSGFKRGYSLG